jgi:tetratricopeptide (TPR) repeat protein
LNKQAPSTNAARQRPSETSAKRTDRARLLLGLLAVAVVVYAATIPWQRKMAAETARLDAETAARQAAASRQGADAKSLQAVTAQVERNPADASAQLQLAQAYAGLGRLDDAEARAQVAVGLERTNPEPLLVLADIEQRLRHYDAAMRAYTAAMAIDPGDARARVGLAYLMISFGWPLEAEALLKPAVAATPGNPYLKAALALAYVQHGDYKDAESLLLEARRIEPDNVTLWSPLVHVYNEMKRYDQAIAVGSSIIARSPKEFAVVDEIGKAYYNLNDDPHAEAAFHQALGIRPDDLTAHYFLGLLYGRTGRDADGIKELETVLAANPDFEQTRKVLARYYARANRTDDAKRLSEEAAKAEALGQKHQRAGLLVAGKPNDPAAHWQMATVYRDEHNNGRALVEVRKTLQLQPDNQAARSLLAMLQSAGTR